MSAVAVLMSGGLDSAVLTVDLLREFTEVWPIYVRFGLRWEEAELAGCRRFLEAVREQRPGLRDLTVLDEPVGQVYGEHWSNADCDGVPDFDSPDEAVYLPGRNVLLLAKASVWCRLRGIDAVALGTLGGNPFSDSTPEFFQKLEEVLNLSMNACLRILRPFERRSKSEVVRIGRGLPLHLTFSCLKPAGNVPCGACNKCAERRKVGLAPELG